jgi:class 3 adenylate cyclase
VSQPKESENDQLSLQEASEKLRWRGTARARAKRLERLIRAAERLHKVTILSGGGIKGAKQTTSMRCLRRYLPQLFVRVPDEMGREFKRYVRSIDQHIDDRVSMIVTPQIEELRAENDEFGNQLIDLAKRVDRIAAQLPKQSKGVHKMT